MASSAADPLRFAIGTFTRLPVSPPAEVDARVAGLGLTLGPIIGAVIGLVSAMPLLLAQSDLLARLLGAVIVVGLAAWITRGLHWDGLADLADGLGSGSAPPQALAVMRRSDIGPFGVMVLGFTASVQVISLARLPAGVDGAAAWVLALAAGRAAIAIGAMSGTRPARSGGLGSDVVGSVSPRLVAVVAAQIMILGLVLVSLDSLTLADALLWTPVAVVAVALGVRRTAARRLGGTTGDVLGATSELTTAAVLLFLSWS